MVKELVDERSKDCHPALCDFYAAISRFQNVPSTDDTVIFSLSRERDDLSQWRGYAREGFGFTVGFSGKAISKGASRDEAEYQFFEVEYEPSQQKKGLVSALKDMEDEAISAAASVGGKAGELCESAACRFDICWESLACANKHKSFQSENEWRIICFVKDVGKKKHVRTRVSGQRLVNYTELFIGDPDSTKLPIVEIGIGPGFTSAEQASAVKALCRETDYAPEIYAADTPYRRI